MSSNLISLSGVLFLVVALGLVSVDGLVTQKTGAVLYAVQRETGMTRRCFYNFLKAEGSPPQLEV